ncbi:MAG: hypothetical protein IMF07_03410 [Proteobacteria bacterium]|nr:hypothetical protein [Pseudomonadota bacterium]
MNHESERHLLFGLLIECPYRSCSKDCPVGDARGSLSLKEKTEYLAALSDAEVSRIMAHHRKCLAELEA